MIDEDRTLQLFGYTSDELKPHSGKPCVRVCEECGSYKILPKRRCVPLCQICSNHTPEFRKKISISGSGRPCSEETRKKRSDATKGTRTGRDNPMFGRCGEDSPSWKGGKTPWRRQLLTSQPYRSWRAAVFERDDFTCQMCDERGCYLEAHHIRPVRDHKNDLLLFDIGNGITLCKRCHNKTKGSEGEFITQFETITRGK